MCLAIPGKILSSEISNGIRVGRVQFGGITREACLDFVPEAVEGDFVMIHVGFAISRVDAEEAERTYKLLETLGMLEEEGLASAASSPAPANPAGEGAP